MFLRNNTLFLVIDMQERLLPKVENSTSLINNIIILTQCSKILNLPVLVTEQYPEGIGPTASALSPGLEQCPKISKRTFSCCREPLFMKALEETGRKQIIIAGIETHVCVFQTTVDLLKNGYEVQVVNDAVGSRTAANKEIGLNRMRAGGVDITCVESAVFELLKTSACAEFKQILRFIK